jgi:proteasome accessory factor B
LPADYGRIHRLLKILTLIQSEPGWGPRRLAQECGAAERSIYRDLRAIGGAGIPLSFDHASGGYVVRKDFFMPALELTLDESLALVALAQNIGGKEQIPLMSPAAKAIAKIRCNLPANIQKELAQIDPHVSIKLPPVQESQQATDVYARVRTAIRGRRALLCEYEAAGEPKAQQPKGGPAARGGEFHFEPYTLFFCQRAWYVVGYHHGRKGVRTLKLVRFSRCQLTDRPYEIPRSFSLDKHLGNAWRMIRGSQTYDVELWFDPQFAENVEDTRWHKTQKIVWQDDQSILFRCRVDGLDEIVWWVLGMGPHCIVKKPRELADRVKELAEQIVKRYAKM